jgi:hypothetical protein
MSPVLAILKFRAMRKLILFCACAVLLAGCAPTGDHLLRERDWRNFPDPALGIKNAESETYSTQQLASPSASPAASVQSAPVTHVQAPLSGK